MKNNILILRQIMVVALMMCALAMGVKAQPTLSFKEGATVETPGR